MFQADDHCLRFKAALQNDMQKPFKTSKNTPLKQPSGLFLSTLFLKSIVSETSVSLA